MYCECIGITCTFLVIISLAFTFYLLPDSSEAKIFEYLKSLFQK